MAEPPPVPQQRCRNCGAAVSSAFCPECGQSSALRRRTLWLVVADFVAHSFAYDGRFWRTMIPLLGKPGFVTEENLRERWVAYLPPLRFYLVVTLVFFAVFSSTVGDEVAEFTIRGAETSAEGEVIPAEDVRPLSEDWLLTRHINDTIQAKVKRLNELPPGERERTYFRELVAAVPTSLFVALPLFALGLKILYIRRRRYFFDHFVFATHYFSVCLLVGTLCLLVPSGWLRGLSLAVYLPLYLYLAMLRVYRQHWFATLAKMILMGFWQIFSCILLLLLVVLTAFFHV